VIFRGRSTGRVDLNPEDRLVLQRADLNGADFSGRDLVQISVQDSRLLNCRFDGTRVDGAYFGAGRQTSYYAGCVFDGARITFGAGGHARFEDCSFRDCDLRNWFCFSVELVNCTFSGRMRKPVFNGMVPERDRPVVGRERNEFRGNDFSAMDLRDVAFRTGIDLSLQRLPSGETYLYLPDASAALQRAREAISGWENAAHRERVLAFLRSLEDELAGGQNQLLLSRGGYPGLPGDAAAAVFELLNLA
jgi:uncharacterized protein YjbI with pentapeptide repeats